MLRIILIFGIGTVLMLTPSTLKSQYEISEKPTKINRLKIIIIESFFKPPSFFMEKGGRLYQLYRAPLAHQSKSAFLENDKLDIQIKNASPRIFFFPNMLTRNITSWLTREFLYAGIIIQNPVFIKAIHFDFDSELIRNDASAELDKLSVLMLVHPNSKVKITACTDARGSDAYNEQLAMRRANSTLKYLLKNGIDINRITIKTSKGNISESIIEGIALSREQIHRMNRRAECSLSLTNTTRQ